MQEKTPASALPDHFHDVEHLEEVMTTPSPALVRELSQVAGDIIILGIGGKVGPTLARLAKRAAPGRRVIGVARFSEAGLRENLTHGWQLSGILQYDSAPPFNIVTGTNTVQTTAQRPCALPYSLTANGGVNPCTEALPGAIIGRNAGTGFDYFNFNARLNRTVFLKESVHLDVAAEAFNALNHRNNEVPNAVFGTAPFPPGSRFTGAPTAVADPRSIQLAARLSF